MARISVSFRVELNLDSLKEMARVAESSGYESIWVPEGFERESFVQLTTFAQVTRTIRLSPGILPIFSRTPTSAAMAAATLHEASGGRALLGLGVGHKPAVERWHGIPFEDPVGRMREYVAILRGALAHETVELRGKHYSVKGLRLANPNLPCRVPIYLAALGPRMLGLAGEVADGVLLNWSTPDGVVEARKVVAEGAKQAGRDPDGVDVACYVRACVTDDVAAGLRALKSLLAWYAALPFYNRMLRRSGFADEAARVAELWNAGKRDDAAGAISDSMAQALGLVGPAAEVRGRIEGFRAAGVDLPIVYPFPAGPDPAISVRRTVEAFAP